MKRGDPIVVRYGDLAGHPTGDPDSDAHLAESEFPGYYAGTRTMSFHGKRVRVLVVACTKDKDGTLGGWNTVPVSLVHSVTKR